MTIQSDPPERTALYRLYDADGDLLYIGISNNPEVRWKQHAYQQPWWIEVASKSVIWLGDREEAGLAERLAIKNEAPSFNLALLPRQWTPGVQVNRKQRAAYPIFNWPELPIYIKHRTTHRPLPALIMDELQEDILAGRLRGGDRLPTLRDLRNRFGTSIGPIKTAIKWLEEDGYIVRLEGKQRARISTLALLPAVEP